MNMSERFDLIIGYQSFMPDEDPLESIDFARGLGMELIELNANMPWFFPERFDEGLRGSLRERARQEGIHLAIHAPEEISLVSPHTSLLQAGVGRLRDFLQLACDLGAEVLTCHLGGNYLRWATGDAEVLFPHQLYPEHMRESIMRSLPSLARESRERGVKLSLENAGCFGPAVIQETVEEVLEASPLYLTWDVGHSNTQEGRNEGHERFFLSHMDRIALVHLHDNDGIADSHSPLGTGNVDLGRALSIARRAGAPISIEVRPRSLIPRCLAALSEALPPGSG